ncbi:MAG: DUF86 domain-containing protein [Candidatus Aenigmarchaeota archaeon]|nr:DUF86 domain-containing protein [Candidatus Aenigmarchaeota archaeon]
MRELERHTKFLQECTKYSAKQLEEDMLARGAVERYLQLAIEMVIEISEILIAGKGFRKPEKYRDAILILGEEGILPKSFAEKFAPSAGFRNILVHHYSDVDVHKLHSFLKNDIKDFDSFARYIVKYLEKQLK